MLPIIGAAVILVCAVGAFALEGGRFGILIQPLEFVIIVGVAIGAAPTKPIPGIFGVNDTSRVAILNGSHKSLSDEESLESVLVFPDYKVVTEVPRSLEGAKDLWESVLNPPGNSIRDSTFESWVLPYSCVILLCESGRCKISNVVSLF